MNLLTADGTVLANPSQYDVIYKDLDSSNSYTSETGVLNRDMIRANHVTVQCQWGRLTESQCRTILSSISGKESLQLKYWDYLSWSFKIGKFYATDRQVGGLHVSQDSHGRYSISFNFVEF